MSINESFEPDSNVADKRDSQKEKQFEQSFSTEEGIQIDESGEHSSKAELSIHESLASYSKATVERNLHFLKEFSPSLVTDEGIQSRVGTFSGRVASVRKTS
jgi:hypothetical protein